MSNENGRPPQEVERLSVFSLAGKLFGINILRSRVVIRLPQLTPLPNSGEIFLGVFHVRGEIFPLIDISRILDLPAKTVHDDDMVILIESRDRDDCFIIGMLVDEIHRVLTYSPGMLTPPKGKSSPVMSDYLQGILKNDDNVIYVLNLDNLFASEQLLAHV